jgi:hypothetical protein
MKLILRIAYWLPGKAIHRWRCRQSAILANKETADRLNKMITEREQLFIETGKQYEARDNV